MEGLRSLGLPFRERNHNGFTGDDQVEDFCPVVVSGLRDKGERIRAAYHALGVPCVVIDYGYLRRVSGVRTFETGHWQVGFNRLQWVPDFDCPSDRFENLELEIARPNKSGEKIIVCGQHVGDPSHGLSQAQIEAWARSEIDRLRMATSRPIEWRPHPDSPFDIEGVETSRGPLDWPSVFAVVCINSNIGHEALLNGVPVICRDDAAYSALACAQFSEAVRVPSVKTRRRYFSRVAYAQWTLEEIKSGLPVRWAMDHGLTERKPK